MMRGLILKKDGFYLQEWNGEKREYDCSLLPENSWLFEWTEEVEIEGKVTLGDVLAILAKLDKGELALFAALAEAGSIAAFIEEAQKPVTEKSDIEYIEIYRYVEINWYKRQGVPDFESYVVSSGRCENDPQRYAFDFVPVNKLLHCEIRLLPTTRFYDNREDYNEQGEFARPYHNPPFDEQDDPNAFPTINGKPCMCAKCEGEQFSTTYKLGEFFWALFDDICFHGAPAERDERMETLLNTVDEYKTMSVEELEKMMSVEDALDPKKD